MVSASTKQSDGSLTRTVDDIDVVIVGAGLAGVCVAHQLTSLAREQGRTLKLCVLHVDDDTAGTNAPAALLHISPGRSFDVDMEQAQAFVSSCRWLRTQPQKFWRETTLLRPTSGATGARLAASLPRARSVLDVAGVSVDVIEESRVQQLLPGAAFSSAFEVGPAFAVALAPLLADARLRLGTSLRHARAVEVARTPQSVGVVLDDGATVRSKCIVLACGAGLLSFVPDAGAVDAGTMVAARALGPHAVPTQVLATAGGVHLCQPPHTPLYVGATRFPPSSPPTLSDDVRVLGERMAALSSAFVVEDNVSWRGVRLVGSKRRPLLRTIDDDRVIALGAFGATGLLWAPAMAARVAAMLLR